MPALEALFSQLSRSQRLPPSRVSAAVRVAALEGAVHAVDVSAKSADVLFGVSTVNWTPAVAPEAQSSASSNARVCVASRSHASGRASLRLPPRGKPGRLDAVRRRTQTQRRNDMRGS